MSDPYLPPERPDQGYPYGYPAPQQGGAAGPVDLPPKPSSVRSLVGVMGAGAVLAVLGILLSLLSTDQVMAEIVRALDEMEMEGIDTDSFLAVGRPLFVGTVILFGLVEAGLWLLFAWLFARGRGRVLGTVLGAVNGLLLLFAVPTAVDTVELLRALLVLGVVVAGLVLLWLPSTRAWFAAARRSRDPRY